MKSFLVLLIVASYFFPFHAYDVDEAFVIAGYLPDYRAYINVNATAIHLTDLMLFSLTPDHILQYATKTSSSSSPPGGCCLSSDHFELIRKARSYKREQDTQQIRLLVTVGGGGRSDSFRYVVRGSLGVHRQFAESLVQLCRDEELDGIDLDFEGIQSLVEWDAYLKFLSDTAEHLHHHGLLLTVALHPGQLLPPDVCQSVDRVHVMTYDMMPPSRPSPSIDLRSHHHHASIYPVHEALTNFIHGGCDPSKLVMGIPAYARHGQNIGLVKTYSEIVDEIMKESNVGLKEVRESIQSLQTSWEGYQFDSPDDVQAKVEYAKQTGLGGIFIWELGQDKQMTGVAEGGILLEAAASSAANFGIGESGTENEVEKKQNSKTTLSKEEL